MRYLLLIFAALAAGCAATGPGTISRTSTPDTYRASISNTNSHQVYKEIIDQAHDYCRRQKLHFLLTGKDYDETSYSITFRCLAAGDPEFIGNGRDASTDRFHKRLGGYGEITY